MSPPIGIPLVETMGPLRPLLLLLLLLPLLGPAPFEPASNILGSASNWALPVAQKSESAATSELEIDTARLAFIERNGLMILQSAFSLQITVRGA